MNVNKAIKEINNALTNTVVEIYGDSGSGKSYIADKVAETKDFALLIDSLMQRTEGQYYIIQSNKLEDAEELIKDFDLVVIDDFFQLAGDPRDNIYKLQEWVYNNKKLSINMQKKYNFNYKLNFANQQGCWETSIQRRSYASNKDTELLENPKAQNAYTATLYKLRKQK